MRGPDAYPTVSGVAAAARLLSARHPDLCRMRLAGESRAGRPLWLLSVGHGRRHVLVVAGPHPDEQAGGGAVLWLAEQAVADRHRMADADLTWDFLLCLDPDGTLLNETGPAGPRPPAVHFRHTYRPAAGEQPERAGSFRAAGDELPETYALLAVIDELRPFLQCTLHGTDVGGSSVRLTADIPGLAEPFGKYAAELDIPVQAGTYDTLFWQGSGPGVYVLPPGGGRQQPGGEPAKAGGSTWCRPHRHGGMTALVEVPMWATRRVADAAPHPEPSHAVAVMAARLRKDGAALTATLDRALPVIGSPGEPGSSGAQLLSGVRDAVGAFAALAAEYDRLAADPQPPLTMAQVAALDITSRRIPLRAAGMLLRLLDEQPLGDGDPAAEPGRLRGRLERRLDAGARELVSTLDARWVPVYDQVELQARTVLAAVDRLG
ncbi:M14 family zinc carboxypeptidase [Streptomyces sp. NBC_01198]|uniref:M14 family zinc carboxypeptidase n=1 Tax=Streptomyces sp. NBC_01198 TaxID=2903769 RepID=UPI002E114234|nr:M14 family zinc carboxypeptidase [Streptomyces sp. NBC_01198]